MANKLSESRCPHCGVVPVSRTRLNNRERSELNYLASHPGIWGGPLDRGQVHEDPIFQAWIDDGLIEARKSPRGWGFFITPAGRLALQEAGQSQALAQEGRDNG